MGWQVSNRNRFQLSRNLASLFQQGVGNIDIADKDFEVAFIDLFQTNAIRGGIGRRLQL